MKIELNILIQLLINRLQVFVDALIGAEQTSVSVALPFTACEERVIVHINLRLVYKMREELVDNNEATLNNLDQCKVVVDRFDQQFLVAVSKINGFQPVFRTWIVTLGERKKVEIFNKVTRFCPRLML